MSRQVRKVKGLLHKLDGSALVSEFKWRRDHSCETINITAGENGKLLGSLAAHFPCHTEAVGGAESKKYLDLRKKHNSSVPLRSQLMQSVLRTFVPMHKDYIGKVWAI